MPKLSVLQRSLQFKLYISPCSVSQYLDDKLSWFAHDHGHIVRMNALCSVIMFIEASRLYRLLIAPYTIGHVLHGARCMTLVSATLGR